MFYNRQSDILSINLKAKKAMRTCKECGIEITGRSDKKFCSNQCRCAYNNRVNKEKKKNVYQVNKILANNLAILQEVYNLNLEHSINLLDLIKLGFNLNYFTSIEFSNRKNNIKIFHCYIYNYTIDKHQIVTISQRKD